MNNMVIIGAGLYGATIAYEGKHQGKSDFDIPSVIA